MSYRNVGLLSRWAGAARRLALCPIWVGAVGPLFPQHPHATAARRSQVVNGKRTALDEKLLGHFAKTIERQRPVLGVRTTSGAPQLYQGHTRFATSSIADLSGCHPHQWTPPSKQLFWRFDPSVPGGYVLERARTVEGFITHNGDLDAFVVHGVAWPTDELQELLAALLHAPMPDAVDSA